MIAISVVPN